jgi:general secretion pathway protein E
MSTHLPPAFRPEQLAQARGESLRTNRAFTEALETASGLGPRAFVEALGDLTGYPVVDFETLLGMQPVYERVPYVDAARRLCVEFSHPEKRDGADLVIADPFDTELAAWLEHRVRSKKSIRLAHRADLQAFLAREEEGMRALSAMDSSAQAGAKADERLEDISLASISVADSAIVKLVSSTLHDALKAGASDVHLESVASGLFIKYRIDGVLSLLQHVEGRQTGEQVISRVKVMAELDIAERRVPQDGRFRAALRGREIDFRVSIMPNVIGEDAVIRILDKRSLTETEDGKPSAQVLTLELLGFDPDMIETLRMLADQPYGMLLVTGPTGSGKTTTLYAVISEVNRGHDKIVTIEDPVEYQLPGILQIPVNEKKGLTFARGLRSILRHDPDRIMVGEIRDSETAEIAIQSALTGHLVYTTVHANNVLDVIGRFTHMGVDRYSFVAALNGILAQRLLRVTCTECRRPDTPSDTLLKRSGLSAAEAVSFTFMRGIGCAHCRGTGYRGRKAIGELLTMNDEMRDRMINRSSAIELKDAARERGMRTLREVALDLVRHGETTLDEINRITFTT